MHAGTRGPTLRRWAAGGSSLVAALAIAACGSDGGPDGSRATDSAAAGPAGFCEASVDVQAVLARGPAPGPEAPPEERQAAVRELADDLDPLLTRVEETAPREVADAVTLSTDILREALETGDGSAVESAEFAGADDRIDEYMLAQCGYEEIRVAGVDHAYEGIPETVPAGVVAVTFANEGTEFHEIGVARIDDDVPTPWPELLGLPQDELSAAVQLVGFAFAEPGDSDTVFLRLEETGRYGAACLVPQGTTRDAAGSGPPHAALGMLAEFDVT